MAPPQQHERGTVDYVLSKKYELQRWKMGLLWGFLNLTLAVLCYVDLQDGTVSRYLLSLSPIFWYLELALGVIFALNFTSDLVTYFRLYCGTPTNITAGKRQLLGINNLDESFRTTPDGSASGYPGRASPPSPATTLDQSVFLTTSTPRLAATSSSSKQLWSSSLCSSSLSASPNDTSRMSSTSASSWAYFDGSSPGKLPKPLFSSSMSPMDSEDIVTDEKSFLKSLEEKEEREHKFQASVDSVSTSMLASSCASGAIWNSHSDLSPYATTKLSYQLSPRNPPSNTSRSESTDSSMTCHGEVVWSKLGITPDQVYAWMENLRKWLNRTILTRIVAEVDNVNEALRRQGTPDIQIGDVGLAILRQRCKGSQISSLYTLLQYLEATPNQEYLIQRLKELEKGGCMSEFRWNSGGTFKGKAWGDQLPTDSEIVMHLFLTYLDSRSPVHSCFPEGKPITARYFCRPVDKADTSGKASVCIYQSKLNPPHYKLLVRDETWELHEGRNNMFHAILLFLYQLKTKEDGMLNHINLGPSGLNLMWILEQ